MDAAIRDRVLRLAGVELRDWKLQPRDPGGESGGQWIVGALVSKLKNILTGDDAAHDYGDELDRVEAGDVAVVARSEGLLTVQGGDDVVTVHAVAGPEEARGWADYIDEGLELDAGETTVEDGLSVARTLGGVTLAWPEGDEDESDGIDLTDGEAAEFTGALRDMAYITEDNQDVPDEDDEDESEGDETEIPDVAIARHRALQLLGFELRKYNPSQKRDPRGSATGGQFTKVAARVMASLTDWLRGVGPDDPLAEFSQPQLKAAAIQLDLNPPKGMRLVPLKALILDNARTLDRQRRDADKPSAKFTLQGAAHRDLDVAVYKDPQGRPVLFEESDSGRRKRGALVQRFDSLEALQAWARDNDEPRLAEWARKEQGGKESAKKAAPAKRVPAKKVPPMSSDPEDSPDVRAAVRRLPEGNYRDDVERILAGSYLEGGARVTDLKKKIVALRRLAGVTRKVADDRHRGYPTPENAAALRKARALADKVDRVTDALESATRSEKAATSSGHAASLDSLRRLGDSEAIRDDLDLRKVDELKPLLREAGLPVSGRKRDLVDRLTDHLAGKEAPAPSKAAKAALAKKAATGPSDEPASSELSPGEMLVIRDLAAKAVFTDNGWVRGGDLPPIRRRHLDALAEKGWLQKEGDLYRIDPRSGAARRPSDGSGALEGDIVTPPRPRESRLPLHRVNRGAMVLGYRDPTDPSGFTNIPDDGDPVDQSRVVRVVVQRMERVDENGKPTKALLAVHRRIVGHDADTGQRVQSGPEPAGAHWSWVFNPDEDSSADIEGTVVDEVPAPRPLPAKKALPRKATPKAPTLDAPPRPYADIAASMRGMTTKDDAYNEMGDLSSAQVKELASTVGVDASGIRSTDALKRRLVEHLTGLRYLESVPSKPAKKVAPKAPPVVLRPIGDTAPLRPVGGYGASPLGERVAKGLRDGTITPEEAAAVLSGEPEPPDLTGSRGPHIEVAASIKDLSGPQIARGEHLTPAGRRALDALGPAGHPRIAAIPDTEGKIREAYRMLAIPGGGVDHYVAFTDLRKLIGDQVPRADVDATLKRMWSAPDVDIAPQSYERENAATRIPAAVVIGGQENNMIHIADPTLARPSQFGALAMADELDARRAGGDRDPMMVNLSDAELQAEIDARAARDPIVARELASRTPLGAPEATAVPKAPRPSGLPTDRKLVSGDFDDLADRVQGKPEARILEILKDLNASELARLARKFSGSRGGGGLGGEQHNVRGIVIPAGLSLDEKRRWLAEQLTDPRGKTWRSEVLDSEVRDRIFRMAGVATANGLDDEIRALDGDEFEAYWTRGEGLHRWLGKRHEWTTLRNLLRKHPRIRDPEGLATKYFHMVKGFYPGSDLHRVEHGKPPRGQRVGPG